MLIATRFYILPSPYEEGERDRRRRSVYDTSLYGKKSPLGSVKVMAVFISSQYVNRNKRWPSSSSYFSVESLNNFAKNCWNMLTFILGDASWRRDEMRSGDEEKFEGLPWRGVAYRYEEEAALLRLLGRRRRDSHLFFFFLLYVPFSLSHITHDTHRSFPSPPPPPPPAPLVVCVVPYCISVSSIRPDVCGASRWEAWHFSSLLFFSLSLSQVLLLLHTQKRRRRMTIYTKRIGCIPTSFPLYRVPLYTHAYYMIKRRHSIGSLQQLHHHTCPPSSSLSS